MGAVAEGQSTELGHVTVNPDAPESCTSFKVNADTLPLEAGLLNENVVFSVSVWLKLVPSCKLTVVAFELDVTATYSSETPLSKVVTPFASAVTMPDAWVSPSVSGSLTVYVAAALCAGLGRLHRASCSHS